MQSPFANYSRLDFAQRDHLQLPMASDTDNSSFSPNKRLKTLKSKIEFKDHPNQHEPGETDNSASQSCAICFLDDGKAIRGKIDCCDHYYCFLCIMEWAKTESRCPICRRRFTTIRRPPKDGVFARERVVKVPICDQVYLPFGNTAGLVHSYEQVLCNVCHCTTDESLLLLCDLCDSAAHTYCVGLGFTVPEGDWFCLHCTASRAEHANVHAADNENTIPTAVPCVLACNIKRESNSQVVERPRTTPNPNHSSDSLPPVVPDRCTSVAVEVARPARTLPKVVNQSTESVARTLDRCRNVHSRIRALRENWNAFRSGSLSFPSSSFKSGCSTEKNNNGVVCHERSGQTQSSSSTSCQQPENRDSSGSHDIDKAWKMLDIAKSKQRSHGKTSTAAQFLKLPSSRTSASKKATNVSSSFVISGRAQSSSSTGCQKPTNQVSCGSHDIDEAWKMMEIAKSKQYVHKKTSSAVQHPKLPSRKARSSEEPSHANSSFDILKSQQLGAWDLGRAGTGKAYKCNSNEKHQSVELEKERQFRVTSKDSVECSEDLSTSNSAGLFESQFYRNLNGSTLLQKNIKQASSNAVYEKNGSAPSVKEGASSSFYVKQELSSSSSKLDVHERNIGCDEGYVESKARKDDDAKSEIQSLVKINLKLLSKDKRLGVDAFKEIARLATHSILAACGLEHQKSCMYSFPSLVCCHAEQMQLPHKSNLMPKSCRACFYGFVKDVVTSIMFDFEGSAKSR